MASSKFTADTAAMRAAIAITASLTVFSFASAPANADRRKPAPIIFAGQGATSPAPATQREQTARTASPEKLSRRERRAAKRAAKRSAAPAAPTRQIEFRYPDQPDTFYGANGARSEFGAAPLSFSSGSAAISQTEAAKLTVGTPPPLANSPQTLRISAQTDPAITQGGFDARAAAARVSAAKPTGFTSAAGKADFSSPAMQSAPLPALQAAVVKAPVQATRPVSGAVFQPVQASVYDKTGTASVFHPSLNGQPTSNGEILDTQAMIAAHPSLPLPSLVQVINLQNNREIVVRVNDRGPIDGNGLIEVSERAAGLLGFGANGASNVRVRYLGPAPQVDTNKRPEARPIAARPAPFIAPPLAAPVSASVSAANQKAGKGDLFLQLASFSDISNAQRLHATLNGRVRNVGIVPVQVRGTDFFRVVAGPISSRAAAERLREQLVDQGIGRGLIIAAS